MKEHETQLGLAFGSWNRKYQNEETDRESSLCETSERSALNGMSVSKSSPPGSG